MVRVSRLRGIAGIGLDGDVNAAAASPRHVLLASAGDIAALGLPLDALRANIVLDRAELASGDVLRLGSLVLRITIACEACHWLDVEQPGLRKRIGERRGLLARVLTAGEVHDGAHVERAGALAPLADHWHERVRQIVTAMPPEQTMSYAALAEVAGLPRAYCRALPAVLRKLGLADRVVAAAQVRARWATETFYRLEELAFTRS